MGGIPADNWWKLITPKVIKAGMNQLNGRKIRILDLVSSDIIRIKIINHVWNRSIAREWFVRVPI